MTITELKPFATTFFNSLVTEKNVQGQFSDAFDLWIDEPSLFDANADNGYKAVIRRYVRPILEELERIDLVFDHNFTKQTTITENVNGQDTENGSGKNISETANTHNDTNGEQVVKSYTYPQGYVTQPDEAFITGMGVTDPLTTSGTSTDTTNAEYSDEKTRKHVNDRTHITEESDLLARAQLIDRSSRISTLIESCVFALLGDRIEYVHPCHRRECVWGKVEAD